MKIRELARHWQQAASGPLLDSGLQLRLDLDSSARLAALCEMFPQRSAEELLGELLGAALEELAQSFPYVRGSRVVSLDEQGDPIYEDNGLTPRFLALTHSHLERLRQSQAQG